MHPEKPKAEGKGDRGPIRLVVTDDHPVFLKGLEALFAREPDFVVVAACETGEQALAAVQEHRPDVLLLDLRLPGIDGLGVLRALNGDAPGVRVVILTAEIGDDETLTAMRLGAAGVVLKEMAARLLLECIRKVHAGERWVERKSVGRALDTLLRREAGLANLRQALTARELDIVRMIVLGLRNAEIASRLSVSEGTVKSHLHHVYEKLGIDSRVELLLYAQERGVR